MFLRVCVCLFVCVLVCFFFVCVCLFVCVFFVCVCVLFFPGRVEEAGNGHFSVQPPFQTTERGVCTGA